MEERRHQGPTLATKHTEEILAVPSVYFNGFSLGLSNADVNAMLVLDGHPVLRLNMSYTTAKTLHLRLKQVVDQLEQATSHAIMPTNEVEAGIRKLVGDGR